MRTIFALIVGLTIFSSCRHSANSHTASASKDLAAKRNATDAEMANADRPDDEQETDGPEQAIKPYLASYNKIQEIDSVITDGNDRFKIYLKYYCLHDSSLVIPKKLNLWQHPPQNFRTNNFATKTIIIKNNDTIFNKIILRDDFERVVTDEYQKKYGVLFDGPSLRYNQQKKLFIIGFSFTIPVTDLGKAVYLVIDNTGKAEAQDDAYLFKNKLD